MSSRWVAGSSDPGVAALVQDETSATYGALRAALVPRRRPTGARPFAYASLLFSNASLRAVGYDSVDSLLFGATQSSFATSTDGGATWSGHRGFPPTGGSNIGLVIGRVLRFKNNLYMLLTDTVKGLASVYRSPVVPGTGSYTWTLVKDLTAGSDGRFFPAMDTDGVSLLVGEYGDPLTGGTKNPHVWRTTDGDTWTATYEASGGNNRHIHGVAPDPYAAGTWYMTNGDGISPCLFKSTDGGVTWTGVAAISSTYQAVQISFTEEHIYLAADVTESDLLVLDRATQTVLRHGSMNDHRRIAVPQQGYHRIGSWTSGSTSLADYVDNPFVSDMVGARVIGTGIPAGATITSVSSANTAVLSAAATSTQNNVPYRVIFPEEFWSDSFMGAVDPATGVYYFITPGNSESHVGGRRGLFCIPYLGGPVVLLDVIPGTSNTLFLWNGYVYAGTVRRPLLAFD